jgi:C4-dicarboxylate transporter/malic acid transport protein
MTVFASEALPAPLLARKLLLGPNWFAVVMGTGIVATSASTLPVTLPGARAVAHFMWVLAAGLLLVIGSSYGWQWKNYRSETLAHAADPVMAQFFGAPPMALMTVGGGALLVGKDWLGTPLALGIDLTLWSIGTVGGLITAIGVPYLMITRHRIGPEAAFGGWLMPVVPPMVSAANGALLVPYLPAGEARLDALLACYALFGVSLVASLLVISQLWGRLMTRPPGPAKLVPTLWIVLGPLGQSITAANLLAVAAAQTLPAPYATGAAVFALLFGVPTWGFAILWAGLATALTLRAVRAGLPFGLPWWSFTFPVGTLVTGTTGLAMRTGSTALALVAVLLFLLLATAWTVVAVRTARALRTGELSATSALSSNPARGD